MGWGYLVRWEGRGFSDVWGNVRCCNVLAGNATKKKCFDVFVQDVCTGWVLMSVQFPPVEKFPVIIFRYFVVLDVQNELVLPL